MTSLDLIILSIYIICVLLVFNQATKSLEAMRVQLVQSELDKALKAQGLQDILGIKFQFDKRYKLDELKKLNLNIENRSERFIVYLDWDHCSLADLGGRSRRVVRIPPGLTLDLMQPQIFSVISPGRSLKETLIAEDNLKRPQTGAALEIDNSKPLIDISSLNQPKSPKPSKQRHADFMAARKPLEFSLTLAFRYVDPLTQTGSDRCYIPCQFTLQKLPWTEALPRIAPPPKA